MSGGEVGVVTWGGDAMPDAVAMSPGDFLLASRHYMTRERARLVTDRIRNSLRTLLGDLAEARTGNAHLALGYETWHEYVEVEFGDLRNLALPPVERKALVVSMRQVRLSQRAIAGRLGKGLGTVSSDLAEARASGELVEPDTIDSADGRSRPARRAARPVFDPIPAGLGRKQEALLRVALQERRGLTSVELDAETGWPMGSATGSLSKLAACGWVTVDVEQPGRGNRGVYVVTDAGHVALEALLAACDGHRLAWTSGQLTIAPPA